MEWYYADESDQQIPFQEENFKGLIEMGSIKPDTLVWNASMTDWKEASMVQPMLFSPGERAVPSPVATTGVPPSYGGQVQPGPDGLGVASMVCGILAILLSCVIPGIGLFPGIAAIICGHMSRRRMLESGSVEGSGIAMAGMVTGYIGTAISLIMVLLMIFAFLGVIFAGGAAP